MSDFELIEKFERDLRAIARKAEIAVDRLDHCHWQSMESIGLYTDVGSRLKRAIGEILEETQGANARKKRYDRNGWPSEKL